MDVLLPYKTVKGRFVYSPVTRGILFTTIALSKKLFILIYLWQIIANTYINIHNGSVKGGRNAACWFDSSYYFR